jgi:murein L,D-transpeptidase YcbB/YkuD
MMSAMSAGEPTTVPLRSPVPVYITYASAVARPSGEVFFYPDIYGHDRTLDRLLQKGYPYSRPGEPALVPGAVAEP